MRIFRLSTGSEKQREHEAPPTAQGVLSRFVTWTPADSALIRTALVAFAIHGARIAANFLVDLRLARWLPLSDFGWYSLCFSAALLIASVASLGLPIAVLRFVPQYLSQERGGVAKAAIRVFWLVTLVSGIVFGAASFPTLGRIYPEAPGFVMLLTPVLVFLISVATFQAELVRALDKLALAYLPFKVLWPAAIVGISFLPYLEATVETALEIGVIALAVLLLFQAGAIGRTAREAGVPIHRTAPQELPFASWAKVTAPLWVLMWGTAALRTVDVVVVGSFVGPEEAGIYNVAARTAALVGSALWAVNAVVGPAISRLYYGERIDELRSLARQAALLVFWPTLAIGLVVAIAATPILGLFGTGFSEGAVVLRILVVGQILNAATGAVGYFANLAGLQKESALTFAFAGALNVALSIFLVPLLGILGAALANLTAVTAWNVILAWIVKDRLAIDPTVLALRRSVS